MVQNCGSVVLEASAVPTVPQPLTYKSKILKQFRLNFSISKSICQYFPLVWNSIYLCGSRQQQHYYSHKMKLKMVQHQLHKFCRWEDLRSAQGLLELGLASLNSTLVLVTWKTFVLWLRAVWPDLAKFRHW